MKRRLCRCGVYVDRHPTRTPHRARKVGRVREWLMYHSIRPHLLAPIWVRIPEKRRWSIVTWLNKSQRRCWCDLVDAALVYREKDDCDTHLPFFGRERAVRCATVCDWGHEEHTGKHACSCYCGKFQFTAPDGDRDRWVDFA